MHADALVQHATRNADTSIAAVPCRNSVDVTAPWTTTIVHNDPHSLIGARGINISAVVGRVITGSISSSSVAANGGTSVPITIVINGTAGIVVLGHGLHALGIA